MLTISANINYNERNEVCSHLFVGGSMDEDFENYIIGYSNDLKIIMRLARYKYIFHDVYLWIQRELSMSRAITEDNNYQLTEEDVAIILMEFAVESKELGLSDEWIDDHILTYMKEFHIFQNTQQRKMMWKRMLYRN